MVSILEVKRGLTGKFTIGTSFSKRLAACLRIFVKAGVHSAMKKRSVPLSIKVRQSRNQSPKTNRRHNDPLCCRSPGVKNPRGFLLDRVRIVKEIGFA
jgi:hypothetical protein